MIVKSGYITKNQILFLLLLTFSGTDLISQNYKVAGIPDSLKQNAVCVVRNYFRAIELKTENRGVEKIHKVLTIMDKNGQSAAVLAIPYDENSTVDINGIILYDKNGILIRKVKKSEVADFPAYSNFILYSDQRMKFFMPDYAEYPYTVEYDYKITSTNNVSYSLWSPVTDFNISAEYAKLSISYPQNVEINFKEVNMPSSVERHMNGQSKTWEMKNVKALEDEPSGIGFTERIPCVYVMPATLIFDKYSGKAGNWQDYGKWVYELFKNRDELTDEVKQKITALLQNTTDTVDRIKILYQFMQQNTRYVAITLGIGGFQPADARSVCSSGYGECKALSNYMCALLRFAGIKSYPALVASGSEAVPVFLDFPNFNQFNHVIVCVPLNNDTIWLECTNQKMPFGFLGDFTDDRDVLLITEDGGKFAHTRKYGATENTKLTSAQIVIDSNGTASCEIKMQYKALLYDAIFELLCANPDDQKKWLYSNTSLPSALIKNYKINDNRGMIPSAIVSESVISRNYCTFSGNYMVLPLNLMNAHNYIPKMLTTRQSDFVIPRSYIQSDTLIFKIPENYQYVTVPPGTTLNSDYGNYTYSVSAKGNEIIYIRKLSVTEGRYHASEYKKLYDFILAVSKADGAKIVLAK